MKTWAWSLAIRNLGPDYTGRAVSKIRVVKAWMDYIREEIAGHSARGSGAMYYTRCGLAINEIATLGRWKSSAVFRYIEEALQEVPLNRPKLEAKFHSNLAPRPRMP